MTEQAFELTSLAMRYWFAFLMLLATLCALRLHMVGRRQARRERRSAPNMEYIGELLVVKGTGSVQRGERYAITRDIVIGRRRKCDVCLPDRSVYPRHARGELRSGGMLIGSIGGAPVSLRGQPLQQEVMVRDGALFMVGGITLQLTLYDVVVEYEVDSEGRAIDAVRTDGDSFDDDLVPFEHEFDGEYGAGGTPRTDYDDDRPARPSRPAPQPRRRSAYDDEYADELPRPAKKRSRPADDRREFAPLTVDDDELTDYDPDDYDDDDAAPRDRRRRRS